MTLLTELEYTWYKFDGVNWVNSEFIEGDPSYTYRDWLFVSEKLKNSVLQIVNGSLNM